MKWKKCIVLLNVASSLGLVVACNQVSKAPVKTQIETKIEALLTAIKNHPAITSKYQQSNFLADPNAYLAVAIFAKHGIEIKLDSAIVSNKFWIGNKDGAITRFINNVLAKTTIELAQIKTIQQLAALFVAKSASDYAAQTKLIARNLNYAWDSSLRKPEKTGENGNGDKTSQTAPTTQVEMPQKLVDGGYWKDKANLVAADSYWNLPNLNYSNNASRGIGKRFYKDIKKTNGKWDLQLSLREWIDVYDTRFAEITTDPNHIYKPTTETIVGAPLGYKSQFEGFYAIYNDPVANLRKTGNNNNGLNGLYSGALFEAKSEGGRLKKVFKLNSILSYNGQQVVLGLSKSSGKILIHNGWEHVVPASKASNVFGQRRKKPKTDDFKYALGDLHNLRPSFHQFFNGPRSNHRFGIVPGNSNKYYGIDFEIGQSRFNLKVVEPRVAVRGDIARIIFYMHNRYHIKYDLDYYKLLLLWARMDPVTPEELALDAKIKKVMGFSNGYVTGAKKLPYDQEVANLVAKANRQQITNTHTPGVASSILWSKKPHLLAGAIKVANPRDKMKVRWPAR